MFGMGTWELLIIMFVILLVFGSKKLPELAQGLGKGIREFKKATNEIEDELDLSKPLNTVNDKNKVNGQNKKKESGENKEESGD